MSWEGINQMTKAELVEALSDTYDDIELIAKELQAEAQRRGWCREYDLFAVRLSRKLSRAWFKPRTDGPTTAVLVYFNDDDRAPSATADDVWRALGAEERADVRQQLYARMQTVMAMDDE